MLTNETFLLAVVVFSTWVIYFLLLNLVEDLEAETEWNELKPLEKANVLCRLIFAPFYLAVF